MKKMARYEKLTIILLFLAIALLGISLIPAGWAEATGILQGIATGIISGVLLLFISGFKSKEAKQLEVAWKRTKELKSHFLKYNSVYDELYHNTYHGKRYNMGIEKYRNELFDSYWRVNNLFSSYYPIKQELLDAVTPLGIKLCTNHISSSENLLQNKLLSLAAFFTSFPEHYDISGVELAVELDKKLDLLYSVIQEVRLLSSFYDEEIEAPIIEKIGHINNSLI